MSETILTAEEVKKASITNTPIHAKQQIKILPGWSDFIENINTAAKDTSFVKEPPLENFERLGHVRFYDKLTIGIDHSDKHPYPGLPEIIEYMNSLGLEPLITMSLMNFADSQRTTSRHSDNCFILYVQAVGSVRWSIWIDGIENQFVLEPGDIIFVPKGKEHEILALSPRAALSFAVKFIEDSSPIDTHSYK
jgi:quercetin dioxygenase-like cupin family protein